MTRADLEAAAAERYPHWVLDPNDERGEDYSEMDAKWQNAEADMQRAAYIQGRLDALPEVPDDAVIEAMAEGFTVHTLGDVWGDDGVAFVGCDCGEWFGKAVDGGWDRAFQHRARAVYAALRGAMQ